jgi:hypothetical protein
MTWIVLFVVFILLIERKTRIPPTANTAAMAMNPAIPSLLDNVSGMKSAMYPRLDSTMKVTTRIAIRIRRFFSPIPDVGKAPTMFALASLIYRRVREQNNVL